jgi:hypothetical protein
MTGYRLPDRPGPRSGQGTAVTWRSIAITLAAATALTAAGCGTRQPGAAGTGHAVTTVNRIGPRARAESYARRALQELRLPPGARRISLSAALPYQLRHPALPGGLRAAVDEHALYKVGAPAAAVNRFLARHVQAGWRVGATGRSGLRSVTTGYELDENPQKLPSWAYQITLATDVARARTGGSLLRVDVQVTWYPPRSAAEHIDPARYRAVTVVVPMPLIAKPGQKAAGSPHAGRTLRTGKTFTSPRIVARLARLLNGLHAMPDVVVNCPAMLVGRFYRLVFLPRSDTVPQVVVTSPGCIAIDVTVGGHQEPPLDPGSSPLLAVMSRLLGVAPAG